MKKCLLLSTMALLLSSTALLGQVMGQAEGKIDIGAIKKNIERTDADIQDPKKSEKWTTWLERGDIYMEAANAPTKGLFRGLEEGNMGKLYPGKPNVKPSVKLRGENGETEYKVHEYDRFTTYFADKKLSMWEENKVIIDSLALDKAAEAYDYAFAIDAKATERAYNGLNEIVKIIKDRAVTYQRLEKNEKAAQEYRRSYIIQQYPLIAAMDTTDLYYAAMNFSVAKKFEDALECLRELVRLGYYGKDNKTGLDNGDVYYYLYHTYNGLDKPDSARIILLEGARKVPGVEKLYRSLPLIYAANADADINDIVPIMEKVFADPKTKDKPRLYSGMGQAYSQRDMNDKALEYFIKAADADKEEPSYQVNAALMYLNKGDQKAREMQEQAENLSEAEYKKMSEEILDLYATVIPYLERAHKLAPDNESVVSLLARLTKRLSEKDDAMKEKAAKYEALNKALEAKSTGTAKAADTAK